jgi:putative two-component system response regulator
MVSGLDDVALAERALRIGAYAYVVKPFTPNDVVVAVLGALRQRRRECDARRQQRTVQEETIQRLCVAVEAGDDEAASHIDQMSARCSRIARKLGLEPAMCDLLAIASPMHDVGKVAVPDEILLKPGPLTVEERSQMEQHAEVGYRILTGSRAPLLQLAASIAWTHHERVDGTGYPRGLKGDEIPIEGRIAAVADVFDALMRDRTYRPRMPRDEAEAIMQSGRGTHFDPRVLDALVATEG